MKRIQKVAYIVAAMISNLMCATVAYKYCELQWGIEYRGYSGPASVAFLWAIPYIICIGVCLVLAKVSAKK